MKHCHQGDVDFDFVYRLLCVVGERAYGCRVFDRVYHLDTG